MMQEFIDMEKKNDSLDHGRPDEHLCPITRKVMCDPVLAADGYSYERLEIENWLKYRNISPITGSLLADKTLIPNKGLQNLIRKWQPHDSLDASIRALEKSSAEEILQRIQAEFAKIAELQQSLANKHIAAFLGNSGAGKSTIINLLAEKELIVDEDGNYVLANPNDPTAMAIGTANKSETLYPKAIQVGELYLLDFPGFNDTDGSERNLINSALIREVLLMAASVRLVFVAGQDQFTADRGESSNDLFSKLRQLFIVDEEDIEHHIVNDGMCVVMKSTLKTEALLKKTNTARTDVQHRQLQSWHGDRKLWQIWDISNERGRESNHQDNLQIRQSILECLMNRVHPVLIRGVNVSALYPLKTNRTLERVFLKVMEDTFRNQFNPKILQPTETPLSQYNQAIAYLQDIHTIWQRFENDFCEVHREVNLLKAFCTNPYKQAYQRFIKENEEKRQTFLEALKRQKELRLKIIQEKTELKSQKVVAQHMPKVLFDFGYTKDFRQAVCGDEQIQELAMDREEQQAVKEYYDKVFINKHMDEQILQWHGIQELIAQNQQLTAQLNILQEKITQLQPLQALTQQVWELQGQMAELQPLIQQAQQFDQLQAQMAELLPVVQEGIQRRIQIQQLLSNVDKQPWNPSISPCWGRAKENGVNVGFNDISARLAALQSTCDILKSITRLI